MKNLRNSTSSMGAKTIFTAVMAVVASAAYAGMPAPTAVQDFGAESKSVFLNSRTTSKSDTDFIPASIGYKTFVRLPSKTDSGSVEIKTTDNVLGTAGAFCKGQASSSGGSAKISPIVNYAGTPVFYTSFKVLFGTADGEAGSGMNGEWTFGQGKNNIGSSSQFDKGNAVGTQGFVVLEFNFTAEGKKVELKYKKGTSSTLVNTDLLQETFDQGVVYKVEIVGNNDTVNVNGINYLYDGTNKTLSPRKFDLYINGILIGDGLTAASSTHMPAGDSINSITFDGTNSTGNAAHIFIDDIKVWNYVPDDIESEKSSITAVPEALNFEEVSKDSTKTLNIIGANIVDSITLSVVDGNKFSVSPTKLPNIGGEVEVIFTPVEAGNCTDTLIISGKGLGGVDVVKKITLTGTGKTSIGEDVSTSISDTRERFAELKVYPNPIHNGQLVIDKGQIQHRERVEVYGTTGVLMGVYFVSEDQTVISLSSLPSGLYLVRVGDKTARILKQ